MGPLMRRWIKTEQDLWQKEEAKRLKIESTQNEADRQANNKWIELLNTLKELKGNPMRGKQFKWSHEYGLVSGPSFAQLQGEVGDRFVGHVNFGKAQAPTLEPEEHWRLIPTVTEGGAFGWTLEESSHGHKRLPQDEDSIAVEIAKRLVKLGSPS